MNTTWRTCLAAAACLVAAVGAQAQVPGKVVESLNCDTNGSSIVFSNPVPLQAGFHTYNVGYVDQEFGGGFRYASGVIRIRW